MVTNFMKSRSILELFVTKYKDALNVSQNELILDPTGAKWNQLQLISDFLSSFAGCITTSQKEDGVLSDVTRMISELRKAMKIFTSKFEFDDDKEDDMILNHFDHYFSEPFVSSFHYLADLLDPTSRGQHLTREQKDECEVTLLNYAKKCDITEQDFFGSQSQLGLQDPKTKLLITAFQMYRDWKGKFSSPFCGYNEHQTIKEWWLQFVGDPSYQPLALVAIRIFSIPASSAAIERNFSDFKNQHSKKRNRLQSERVAKLVAIIQHDRTTRVSEVVDDNPEDSLINFDVQSDGDCEIINEQDDSSDIETLDVDDIIPEEDFQMKQN